jgi:hypothetical protein
MTLVRQQAFQNQGVRESQKNDPRSDAAHGEEGSQVIAHLGLPQRLDAGSQEGKGKNGGQQQAPSDSMVNALAYQIANLDQKGIDRAVKNLSRVAQANAIPTDNPLATIGPFARAAVYQRGSLRRMLYSQPLPGMLNAKNAKLCGIFVSLPLRKRLEKFLKNRPKKGFGYIIANGDLLDDLLEEAYEDCDENDRAEAYIAAFLEYNRHLGLTGPEALNQAVGQLLFFPEMQELLKMQDIIDQGLVPSNFPAIEAFLSASGLPESAAKMFHWVPPRLPTADANLTTAGKPFAFSSPGYSATAPFNAGSSDIPETWVQQGMSPEMHNARLNSDKPYMRNLLATGRYNHIRV